MRNDRLSVALLTIALSLVKQARHVVRVDTWLCESTCGPVRALLDQ